jgi:hypothetical protein
MRTLSKAEQKKFEKLKVDLGTIVLGTATPQKRAGFVRSVKGCAEREATRVAGNAKATLGYENEQLAI